MRILYVLHETTLNSGANKSFFNFINNNKHVEAIICCPDKNGIYACLKQKGFQVINLSYKYNRKPYVKGFRNKILFIPRLIKYFVVNHIAAFKLSIFCKKFRPDIIHSNTSVINVGYLAAKIIHVPHVMHIREYGDLDHSIHICGLSKILNDNNNFSIFITKDLIRYKKQTGNPNCVTIYNGIVQSTALRFNSKKSKYFLYAGKIDQSKGIKDLLAAYAAYCNSINGFPVKLKIAGFYNDYQRLIYQQELKEFIDSQKISSFVEWLGERDDVPELMYHAKATIIPSQNEAFGRVMPEAMANGCLVIARDTAGSHEQFENGLSITKSEIGLRFKDVAELTKILKEVAQREDEDYFAIIKASQQTVMTLYTNESNVTDITNFYVEVIHSFYQHNKSYIKG